MFYDQRRLWGLSLSPQDDLSIINLPRTYVLWTNYPSLVNSDSQKSHESAEYQLDLLPLDESLAHASRSHLRQSGLHLGGGKMLHPIATPASAVKLTRRTKCPSIRHEADFSCETRLIKNLHQ